MDGFTGSETATTEELPGAVAVDSFHVVPLAGDVLDQCRRRVQQQTCGHRVRSGDRLEHLRGSAISFRNLINHIARSLLGAGGCRPWLHLRL